MLTYKKNFSFWYTFTLLFFLMFSQNTFSAGQQCRQTLFGQHSQKINHEEIFQPNGFPGNDYKKLFSQSSELTFTENAKVTATHLKELVDSLDEASLIELKKSLSNAESVFNRYFADTAKKELLRLKMALYGAPVIAEWISRVGREDTDKEDLVQVGILIHELGLSSSEFATSAILKNYYSSSKIYGFLTQARDRNYKLPPRRSYTYLLKIVNDWPTQIIQNIKNLKGKNKKLATLKIYQTHFDRVSEKMKSLGRDYGLFSSDLVVEMLKIIQSEMKSVSEEVTLEDQKKFEITLDGSFFNGLAKSGSSDIDFFYNHPQLSDFVKRSSLKDQLTHLFKEYGFYRIPLELQDVANQLPESVRNQTNIANKLGELGTISIRVQLDKIELLVYPVKNRPGDNVEPEAFVII